MKIFSIDGYFKEDKTEFYGYLVAEYDQTPEGWEDEDFFYYGLSEGDLKASSEDDCLEFVITNYEIINNN
jgi:hypothetical protein